MMRLCRALSFITALAILLGLPACTPSDASSDVWLDHAPHLIETGWSPMGAGERALRASASRAVLQFFAPVPASLSLKVHALTSAQPLLVRVSANGGCEIATWDVAATRGEGGFSVPKECVKTGPNLLEFECLRGTPSSLAIEGFALEGGGAVSGSRVEPLRIGQEIRRALISAGSTIEVPLAVTSASTLETAIGVSGRGWARSAGGVSTKVSLVSPTKGEKVLFERTLGQGGEGAGRWTPIRADLAPYAGTTVMLRVTRDSVAAGGKKAGRLPAFADPANFVSLESPLVLPAVASEGGPPPVVLVVFDTMRYDHLPVYGYARPTSPNLQALSKDAVVFETCLSAAPWTLPSITTILTGLYPGQHLAGLRRPQKEKPRETDEAEFIAPFRTFRSVTRLSPDVRTLGEWSRDAGYESAAFVENSYLSERSGLARGFSRYLWISDFHDQIRSIEDRRRMYAGDAPAREWLDQHAGSRVFLFRHYISPHMPYVTIPGEGIFAKPDPASRVGDYFDDEQGAQEGRYSEPERRRIVDLYDESIRLADRRFGDLLAALKRDGLYEKALIIVTSDHGEEFWDHDGFGHGHTLYQELLHVPLIVKLPANARAGTRVVPPARLIDLAPTILGFMGAPVPPGLPGRSLAPGREPGAGAFESFAEGCLFGPPRQLARRGSTELIATGPRSGNLIFQDRAAVRTKAEELFDLAEDPREKRDLASSRPDLLGDMRRVLADQRARMMRAPSPGSEGLELSDEDLDQLESLGYVHAPRRKPPAGTTGATAPTGPR